MKLITLTGLVSVEKAELTHELASHFANGQHVIVIDNIARIDVESDNSEIGVHKIEGNIMPNLSEILHDNVTDVAIVALSEQAHPEKLFVALDELQEQEPDWKIYSLAMIDTRTCDCFPNVREALEMYADISVMIPYQLAEILNYVDTA